MNCIMSWEQQQQVKAIALSYEAMKTRPSEYNRPHLSITLPHGPVCGFIINTGNLPP